MLRIITQKENIVHKMARNDIIKKTLKYSINIYWLQIISYDDFGWKQFLQ